MKKVLCLILAMNFAVFAVGCGGAQFEDTNGPDVYDLEQITDENIIKLDYDSDDYSLSAVDGDVTDFSALTEVKSDNFNGVAELYHTHLEGDSGVIVDVSDLQVVEGNFNLCVVHNGEIVYKFTNNEIQQSFELPFAEGDISVVAAGESANFYMNIEIW